MAITSVNSAANDKDEYSKFEVNNAIIRIEVSATGARLGGDAPNTMSLTAELVKARRNRDVVVATTTVDLNTYFNLAINDPIPTAPSIYMYIDTRDALSADLINLIRRGNYYVKVYQTADDKATPALVADTPNFFIGVITVDRMRSDWVFGIDLQASDIRAAKQPPRQITGIFIKEVSRNHRLSWFPIKYAVESSGLRFLSWDNGQLIPITPAFRDYMLPASGPGAEYVVVQVDYNALPTSSVSEDLFIEEDRLDDVTLRRYINDSVDHVENTLLQVYLEPTQIVTDIDPSQLTFSGSGGALVINADYDFIKNAISFYPRQAGHWIDIHFPYPSLLRVDQLYGAVANTRVVQINNEWIEIASPSGFVQLVPFNTEVAFDFIGLVWVEALRNAVPIPNFWHYNLLAGLRECPGDILELTGRHAAIPILTAAGAAFRGGYSSQSISRDGVSESVSYTSSAIYGVYSASIEDYRNWIRENLPAMRNKYRGPQLTVL
jgi:hypothetical protein